MCSRTGAITNRGYHLEHNFGHGKEHLAALLACFNLLAFAIHTVCDLASGAWRHARETLGPRARFFQNLRLAALKGDSQFIDATKEGIGRATHVTERFERARALLAA